MRDWDPFSHLRSIEPGLVQYSGGFLSSQPERWFPNLSSHWSLLAANLNLNLKTLSVRPLIEELPPVDLIYNVSCGNDAFSVGLNSTAGEYISMLLLPDSGPIAQDIVMEYIARRFVSSLAMTWSGPAFEELGFVGKQSGDTAPFLVVGAVQLSLELNERQFDVWLQLSAGMVERLDGLWRRQTKSIGSGQLLLRQCDLELTSFEVPVTEINSYLSQGNIIPIERDFFQTATLVNTSEILAESDVYICDNKFALRIRTGKKQPIRVTSGNVRISVVLVSLNFESALAGQLARAGSIIPTAVEVSNLVSLKVDGQVVTEALLKEDNTGVMLQVV